MKRDKREIIANILEVCITASSKANVVRRSHLNFRTINPYLDSLIINGHIILTDEKIQRYKITNKGKELLAVIKEAHEFV